MRIDAVSTRPDRAGKYRVQLSDGSSIGLYRQTIEDFGLYNGKEMTDQEFAELKKAAGKMSAKMRAVRIVAASSVSKRDLAQRLISKGEKPQDAEDAVAWMSQMDLLDDRKTAEQVVHRCISKGYGLARAKQALYEKRIPKELWQEVLEDYPDQTEKILEFLRNRLGDKWDQKELRRATDALLRKGHTYSQVRGALQMMGDDSFFQEDE